LDKLPDILISSMLTFTDAPKVVKGYGVHIFFIVFALFLSTTVLIWNLILGQQLRGTLLTDSTLLFALRLISVFILYFCAMIKK